MQIERIMRRPEVESVTGLPCSTLYELMAEGEFPKNIPIHGRAKGWIESEVLKWVSERIAAARGCEPKNAEHHSNIATEVSDVTQNKLEEGGVT